MNVMVLDRVPVLADRVSPAASSQPTVMIVGDDPEWAQAVETICDFFDIGVELVSSELDVGYLAREFRPMAIITAVDLKGQDGFHVMREIAGYAPDLPMMVLTGYDPAIMGAAEAMQEVTGLTSVRIEASLPSMGELVDFLFRAGRQSGVGRMMAVSYG